jgi:SAM-dependent methyltransferase
VLALVGYPLIVEPMLRLNQQAAVWSVGFVVWGVLTMICALNVWSTASPSPQPSPRSGEREKGASPVLNVAPSSGQKPWWIVLAFVPSSYLLGVTTFMTGDIAAVPLLWIIPLALYLLSFTLAFAQKKILPHKLMVFALPTAMLGAVLWMLAHAIYPAWLLMSLHLLAFFIAAMVCHGELARTRPSTAHLTQFYLMISLGGVLGGIFNALIAPLIFSRTIEYPLAMFLACVVCPPRKMFKKDYVAIAPELKKVALDLVLAPAVGILAWLMLRFVPEDSRALVIFLLLAPPVLLAMSFVEHRMRFALAVGALLLVFLFPPAGGSGLLATKRSFFGVHRVMLSADKRFVELYHGTTLHGRQWCDPATLEPLRPDEPLTYYTSEGPGGQVLRSLPAERLQRVAMVGLGTGTVAAYARPGTRMTFFEIDPVVRWVAEESGHFSYISAARQRGADVRIVLGDARLTLANVDDASLDLLLLDAFSGDAVPVHLLTRQALQLYLRKLKPQGLLLAHISNRYLELKPVLANVATSSGCVASSRIDIAHDSEKKPEGWQSSEWVIVARRSEDLESIAQDQRWTALTSAPSMRVWTDDYSNILRVFRWRYTTPENHP